MDMPGNPTPCGLVLVKYSAISREHLRDRASDKTREGVFTGVGP